jgi:hypothetical protein
MMEILEKIEKCILNKELGCNVTALKTDFVVNMSMAMGAKYAGTYSKILPKLFDLMVQSPPAGPQDIIAIIGTLMLTFVTNTVMSLISGIPGFGEIDPIYIAFNQAMTLFPIFNKIKNILSVNIMDLFISSGSYTQIGAYINSSIDAMVRMKGIDDKTAQRIKERAGQINVILERIYADMKEYMKKHKTDEEQAEKGTLGKLKARLDSMTRQMKNFVTLKSEPTPAGVAPVEEKKYIDRLTNGFASMSRQLQDYINTSKPTVSVLNKETTQTGGRRSRRVRVKGGIRSRKSNGSIRYKHKATYKKKTRSIARHKTQR